MIYFATFQCCNWPKTKSRALKILKMAVFEPLKLPNLISRKILNFHKVGNTESWQEENCQKYGAFIFQIFQNMQEKNHKISYILEVLEKHFDRWTWTPYIFQSFPLNIKLDLLENTFNLSEVLIVRYKACIENFL